MQEGGLKVEPICSTRFHNTLWNIIGSDRTSYYIDGIIHSVFAESPTVSQFYDSDTQIQTIYSYITEVYRLNTLLGSVRNLITLLKYTLFYYIAELYPFPPHCWGIPYLFTLLSNYQFQYIAELYPILAHCWGKANIITFLSFNLS